MLSKRRDLLLLTGVVLMVVFITSLQDIYATKWNNTHYVFYESMAYKIFWVLFIPFYFLLQKGTEFLSKKLYVTKYRALRLSFWTILPIVIGVFHLFLFVYLLHVLSTLFNAEPWNLELLIKEKLTTRLYIVLTVYALLSFIHYRLFKKKQISPKVNGHLTVKNGSLTTLVKTDDIKWIKADNGYLELQTCDRKHVIVDSLKNVLENLDPTQFKRIHKSSIINLKMIKSFKSRNNGDYDVILNDGTSLRLSRNYVKPIKDLMF